MSSNIDDDHTVPAWPEMPLIDPRGRELDQHWHCAINDHAAADRPQGKWPRFMYDAKHAAHEVPRLALLYKKEREGTLAKTFRRCACCSEQKHVEENHLTCCLGVECLKCPHLVALDRANLAPEQLDWIKAWTCVGHILSRGGDVAGEGFVTTVDDRMFWDGLYESLAAGASAS